MPYIGRAPTASITKLEDADQDTKIQVEESSDEDIIRFDIAGAEDFTMTANTFTAAASSIVALDDGAVGTPALTNTGDLNTGVYFPAADTVGMVAGGTEQFRFGSNPIPGGSKNLIINGSMTVAQRGSKAVDTNGDRAPTDMWLVMLNDSAGRFTLTHNQTGPLGHGYSLKADCTTAEDSLAASDVITLRNNIEAQNLQHLRWGEASAKDVTLSFWMSSPKSGTHCVTLNQPDSSSRHYISEFTVASADTWEHFKITIPGDTGGGIDNDRGAGLSINFPLVCGSTFQNTKDTWAAGEDYGTSSVQNLLDSDANNIYLAGVQLEVGSVATDFAHEDIGTTLHKCRRYFERIGPDEGSEEGTMGVGMCYSATGAWIHFPYIEKRAIPTISVGSGDAFYIQTSAASIATSVVVSNRATRDRSGLSIVVASGMVADEATHLRSKGADGDGYIDISAEL